ncbi:hypothetical protein [uncultured Brachyspira sp.]|uniref:hypothetical protein n=1 Tax=uncultured Brachyspira sp. TaxID=221953 RepID=UPI0025E93313|nr:hypothetical protein [uncultured Brachyspira sp.]
MSFDPFSAFTGIFTGIGDLIQNKKNFNLQKEQFNYQKELNEKIMQREDSAIQRRAADMKEAGFTKWGASGSPAASTPVTSAPAPQSNIDFSGLLNSLAGFMNARTQAKAQKADERLKNQEIINMQDELKSNDINRTKAVSETNLTDKQRERLEKEIEDLEHNREFNRATGISKYEMEQYKELNVSFSFLKRLSAGSSGLSKVIAKLEGTGEFNVNGSVNVASLIMFFWRSVDVARIGIRGASKLFNDLKNNILDKIPLGNANFDYLP